MTEGVESILIMWFAMVPVLSVLLTGRSFGVAWSALSLVVIVGYWLLDINGYEITAKGLPAEAMLFSDLLARVGLVVIITVFLFGGYFAVVDLLLQRSIGRLFVAFTQ